MSNFAIIADPASGLYKDLRERYGIDDIIPGHLTFPDGSDHVWNLDWEGMTPDEYYLSMARGKKIYRTAAPNPDEIKNAIERALMAGRDVLIVALSSGMSGTYNVMLEAKKELGVKYPDRKMEIVDSKHFSAGIILMNIKASEMREQGFDVTETAAWLREHLYCYRQAGPMNDLRFLARSGRISGVKAFFGTLASINAIGEFGRSGMTEVLGNVKGVKRALRVCIEYAKATAENIEDQTIVISHSYRPKEAAALKALAESELHPKEIIENRVDMICGANIGPGMAAIYYLGKPISEDLSEERELIAALTKKFG